MITYHSEIILRSKHPFRMIAKANIDKLMITFKPCPYSRTSTVLNRANTCTSQKSIEHHQLLPDGHSFAVFLPREFKITCLGKLRCYVEFVC